MEVAIEYFILKPTATARKKIVKNNTKKLD